MTPERQFGSVANYPVGSHFASRIEVSEAGLHRPPQAGISGSKKDGADSIVLNGGYIDDEDYGDSPLRTDSVANVLQNEWALHLLPVK
jgi:putative restriction endonuclease